MGKISIKLSAILFGVLALGMLIYQAQKPVHRARIDDVEVAFRVDLRKAKKIPIENEERIGEILRSEELKEINLVFVNSTQNILVKVQIVEVAFKLTVFYETFGWNVTIRAMNVSSYGLGGSEEKVLIALVPPIFANQTKVYEKDFVIYVEGKNPRDFDLATARFLMAALRIEV